MSTPTDADREAARALLAELPDSDEASVEALAFCIARLRNPALLSRAPTEFESLLGRAVHRGYTVTIRVYPHEGLRQITVGGREMVVGTDDGVEALRRLLAAEVW